MDRPLQLHKKRVEIILKICRALSIVYSIVLYPYKTIEHGF